MRTPSSRPGSGQVPTARRAPISTSAAIRPLVLVLGAGLVAVAAAGGHPASSLLLDYRTRALAVVFVVIAATGFLVGDRRRAAWGFELVPAAAGSIAAMTLLGALAGTPFGPGGLSGDQTFRTAAVTRFADSWHNQDFTAKGLPTFYPPAYFWVLGRFADVFGIEPWRMMKVGAVVTALVIPMVAFVMWRRVVSDRVAALASVVGIVVENLYEPYSWLVVVAFVPWWLEVVCGLRRTDRAPGNTVLLGAIGATMLVTYWYFFTVGLVALLVGLGVDRLGGRLDAGRLRTTAHVTGITAVLSAWYWLPLLVSVARADRPESIGNRWFSTGHPDLPLPMLEPSVTGAICLTGVVFLASAYGRDAVARGLALLLAGTYVWYLIGAVAAEADHPLLTFRSKPLITMNLLFAGLIGVVRLTEYSASRFRRAEVVRVAAAIGIVAGISVSHGFIGNVRNSYFTEAAHAAIRPEQSPPLPSAAALQRTIESRVGRHAVVLSDRVDILALYPNHAFVVWDAHYAHPASEFGRRIEFLGALAHSDDPTDFRALVRNNPYDAIDAFVLAVDGDDYVFRYGADAFPAGTRTTEIRFPRSLFAEFEQIRAGDHIIALPG
jgi:galactan 5-O-arabinofuranosyltransferase